MLDTIDIIAFMNINQCLTKYLQDNAKIKQSEVIAVAHQQIAYDYLLGSDFQVTKKTGTKRRIKTSTKQY